MKNKISAFFWFLFLTIYLEIIYKIFIFNNLLNKNTLNIIIFIIPIAIILFLLCNVFNKKVNFILSIIISLFLPLWFGAQLVYFEFYGSIFSIFSLTTGATQILGWAGAIWDTMVKVWYVLLLFFLPSILFTIFGRKIFNFTRLKVKGLIILFVVAVSFFGVTLHIISSDRKDMYSLYRLYNETHAPIMTVNKMGLFMAEKVDFSRFIFGFEEKVWVNTDNGEINDDDEEIIKIEYNTLDIDFEKLIKNEKKSKIVELHKYFMNTVPSKKNSYTNLMKDKNLIFITAEAFDTIAIDKELTPTLYKLANEGVKFNNYYQPTFTVSTSDGEYMNMTSLIPKEGVWSTYQSSKIDMPFAIGNMFKKMGYSTLAYHNQSYTYYKRNKSHPNMGFKYLGCGNGLEKKMNCKKWPNSDYEMIEGTYKDFINEKTSNFAIYYMTVSGHLEYNNYGNSMAKRNWNLVKNLNYSYPVKAYLACNIELDKAMESLLKHLEEAGLLDDTLIVLGPDHEPYGLKNKELNEISSINRDDKFNLYKTTLIMYNPLLKDTVVDKYASSIDIIPTVYNLFGLNFDSRLFMGRDLFSDDEGLVMLSDRSWITDKGRYNSLTKKFIPEKGVEVEQSYIDQINAIVYQKFSISSLILGNDYYSKLGL